MEQEEVMKSNYIKRERLRKEETAKVIKEMRAALPEYSLEEIRQYRLPFHEALLIGLEENGYICTASFIKELLEFQATVREQAGPGTNTWTKPQLIHSRNELNILSQGLQHSENFHMKEEYLQEIEEFLKLAIHFSFLHQDWWWLGEQLLIQAIKLSTEYTFLGGKYEAISRFAYAKFQIENVKEYETAMEQLKIARDLSNGRGWNTNFIFPKEQGTLFMQINDLMYICLIREAKVQLDIDCSKAAALAVQARKRASEACDRYGETKSLLLKGVCELNMNQTKSAITSFSKAFHIQQKISSHEGMCKARIQLAKAYLMDGNTQQTLKTLMSLKEIAEKYNLPFYLGQAYKNLGEYFLNNGEPQKANPLLNEALKIFHTCEVEVKDIDSVRNLEAISAGLELFPKYLELLAKTERPGGEGFQNLMKLVDWKDSRKKFWSSDYSLHRYTSLTDIIKESFNMIRDIPEEKSIDGTKDRIGQRNEVGVVHDKITLSGEVENKVDEKNVIELHDEIDDKQNEAWEEEEEALIELHYNKETFTYESKNYIPLEEH